MEKLEEIDGLEITTIVDNYIDFFIPDTEVAKRIRFKNKGKELLRPVAEMGFSILVKTINTGEKHALLFDAGMTENGVMQNLDAFGINLKEIEAIVLSHGHPDHSSAILEVLKKQNPMPMILHPDAYLKRFIIYPDGEKVEFPELKKENFIRKGAEVTESTSPTTLWSSIMISGEIERQTDFEKGFPLGYAEKDGKMVKDYEIKDDQALVANLKHKGLVVISGCAHAGIVNSVHYARKITGVKKIYAIMGGFHLTGPMFEPLIERTVKEIKKFRPKYVIPTHCTGWKAINKFSQAMPKEFILNSVGTKLLL